MKKLVAVITCMAMLTVAMGCSTASPSTGASTGQSASTPQATAADTAQTAETTVAASDTTSGDAYVLRFNLVGTDASKRGARLFQLMKDIEEASEGTLKIECYNNEALGATVDMIEACSLKSDVIQDCDPTHLADYVPDYSIFMHPFLMSDGTQIEKLWQSELGQDLERNLEASGLHVVSIFLNGTRHLNTKNPVYKRADTANMKLRCASTKMWNATIAVLGGNATNTPWSEVYTALSSGVAEGCECTLAFLYDAKTHEVCPYVTLTAHTVAPSALVMSQSVYESLPAKAQEAIDKLGLKFASYVVGEVDAEDAEYRKMMEDEGVTFIELSDEDRQEFIEAAKGVSDEFPEWSEGLYDKAAEAIR